MPIISENTLKRFQSLCEEHHVPSNPGEEGFSWSLLIIMSERLDGEGFTTELEHLDDSFPIYDLSRLLIQIKLERYSNPTTIKCLEEALTEKLKEKVSRYGKALVVHKGSGPDGNYIIKSQYTGEKGGFSLEELGNINDLESDLIERARALRGKHSKGSNGSRFTRSKDLRIVVGDPDKKLDKDSSEVGTGLFKSVNKLPFSGRYAKYCFVFDFLAACNYLSFMEDPESFDNKDKYNYVASLVL